jgi:hypothetical protein
MMIALMTTVSLALVAVQANGAAIGNLTASRRSRDISIRKIPDEIAHEKDRYQRILKRKWRFAKTA